MYSFHADICIIGVNPFVFVPDEILAAIFVQANTAKGPIPIRGMINGKAYTQTLVRYSGHWRLYINTKMLKDSPKRVGERVAVAIEFDPADRRIEPHPKLVKALQEEPAAREVFDSLPLSRQKEIVRYISVLKSADSVDKNIKRAIDFLLGKGRFIGRDKP